MKNLGMSQQVDPHPGWHVVAKLCQAALEVVALVPTKCLPELYLSGTGQGMYIWPEYTDPGREPYCVEACRDKQFERNI